MKKKISLMLTFFMIFGIMSDFLGVISNAAVNYVTAVRNVSSNVMYTNEELEVNLQITGTPNVNVVKPNDIVLVLDKSGSMGSDNRFNAMKESAKEFIDLIDFNNHSVGVVDFSSTNYTYAKELTTDTDDLKQYIDNIVMNGGTETGVAIRQAMNVLANGREDAQPVILLLTDGAANSTSDALKAAQEAKDAGIVFYTIALLGANEDPNTSSANQLMQEMATTSHHHHFVLGSVGLIDIYRAIVKEIGLSSAYDVTITETISEDFEIVPGSYESNIPRPTVNGNTLTWHMLELKNETLNLTYKIRPKNKDAAGKYYVSSGSKITYKDYAGKNCSYTIPNTLVEVKHMPPTITSIEAEKGKVTGGESVTIKGDNFRAGATVKFGRTLATDVVVVDKNTITATTPAGVQGSAIVTVTNDDKQAATVPYYYYAEPVVDSITPASGPFIGGTNVKIYGKYFMPDIKVFFGTEEAAVKYYNSTYLIATSPKAVNAGAVDITLTNGDGTSTIVNDGYTYDEEIIEKLEIDSLQVVEGPQMGGTRLNLYGKNIDNGAKVYFGTEEATVIKYYNSTYLLLTTPAQTNAGLVNVTIENLDGETVTLTDAFNYLPIPAPKISNLSITSGELVGGETMVIEGENFNSAAEVTIGGVVAPLVKYTDATLLSVKVPAGTEGKVDVVLTNPDGQSDTVVEGYEYLAPPPAPAPELTSISVTSGLTTGGTIAYIEGKNFVDGLTVEIGGEEAVILNYYSSAKIRIKIPAGNEGIVDIVLTNPDGQSDTMVGAYEYVAPPKPEAPEITSLSATTGTENGGEIIYIEGKNFVDGLTVEFGSETATILNFYNSTKIRIKVPANQAGDVTVKLTNPDGQFAELANGYTYTVVTPEIISLSITSGELKGGELVTIKGTNFQEGVKVFFGSEEAEVVNYYSTASIRVKVPESKNSGVVDVTVINPNNQSGVMTNAYTYNEPPKAVAPVIECFTSNGSLSNKITETTSGKIIYIHGTGFQTTGTKTTINIYDESDNLVVQNHVALNVYTAIKMRFRVPTLTSGTYKFTVVNQNDGTESEPVTLTIK